MDPIETWHDAPEFERMDAKITDKASKNVIDQLRARNAELEAEKEEWMETAAQHLQNEDYYRGLVQTIGKHFGADAYISEDGSIQQDILCAKVPYLVMKMNERLWELEAEVPEINAICEGLDSYAAVCVANVQRLEAERDDYKGKMEASINLLVLEKKCNGLLIERINEFEAGVCGKHVDFWGTGGCPLCKVEALEAEVARLKGDPDSYDNTYKRNLEHQKENGRLREEVARLKKPLSIKPKKQRRKICKNCVELGHSCFGSGKSNGFGHNFCVEVSDGKD